MSYGYHRLGSNVDPIRAKAKMAGIASRLFGTMDNDLAARVPEPEIKHELEDAGKALGGPTTIKDTMLDDREGQIKLARLKGYTGSACNQCFGFNVKMNGHCEVCTDCGATTGCS